MSVNFVETKKSSYFIVRYYEPTHKKTLTLRCVPSTGDWDRHGPDGPNRCVPGGGPGLMPKKPWNHWPILKFESGDVALAANFVIRYIITLEGKESARRCLYFLELQNGPILRCIRSSIIRGDLRRKRYSRIR